MKLLIVAGLCLSIGFVLGYSVAPTATSDDPLLSAPPSNQSKPKQASESKPIAQSLVPSVKQLSENVSDVIIAAQMGRDLASPEQLDPEEVERLVAVVDSLDDHAVQEGLSLFFADNEQLASISDHRDFAKSLLRELGSKDSDVDERSEAVIYFSLSPTFPLAPSSTLAVSDRQKIYAHIDLANGLGIGDSQLYVRWKNLQTKEVLLFTNKQVNQNSSRHWVSFTPGDDWQNHPYEVTFYRFNAGLDKLAASQYSVILSAE